MKYCDVVRDLLPLYAAGQSSESSNALIEKHLECCTACRVLLERTRTRTYNQPTLERQKHKLLKKVRRLCAALAVVIAACCTVLWSKGVFHIADRQISPNGAIITTAYSKNVAGLFPTSEGFTIKDMGAFMGTSSYLNASFDGMWWSPDGNYLVISVLREGEIYLTVQGYLHNSSRNLDAYLGMALYQNPNFCDVPYDEYVNPNIEYHFMQWSEHDNAMLLYYMYLNCAGIDQRGYFWYNYETGTVSGVSKLPVEAAAGVI